jgi:glutamyl-tRNA reductase
LELYLVGIDHHVAPLAVRECLAVPKERVEELVREVHRGAWADEALLLATCNRTELYVVSGMPDGGELAVEALAGLLPGAPDPDSPVYRLREGETAARHAFRVAAGLESAILGETEIQGQLREAHEIALAAGTAGRFLDRLARGALKAGKRVRTDTRIASGGVSHGNAAATVTQRIFGRLGDREVLVIGAGEMAAQTARALVAQGCKRFVVANRTLERGQELAAELPDGRAVGLEEVDALLPAAHVVVVAGGARPLGKAAVAQALHRRREPLLVVDLCVPRLAEESIADLPGVFLYHLDALEELVAGALAQRHEAVPEVEAILAEEYGEFRAWQRTLGALPAIHSMNEWAELIRQKELSYLPAEVNGEVREAVEKLTRRLVKKILARPASRVVQGMEKADPSLPTPDHLRSLFGLEEKEKSE